jgi:hypothetical protein
MPNATGRLAALVVMVVVLAGVLGSGCGMQPPVGALPESPGPPPQPYTSAVYGDPAHWLCRPGRTDPCSGDLDATVIAADGTTSIEPWTPAADPAIDCFYVYPTVSRDAENNSDLVPGPEEVNAVRSQAARFGSTCRVFAPVYRQVTVSALGQALGASASPDGDQVARALGGAGRVEGGPLEVAHADVLDAFRQYLERDSSGRRFLLLGHSQGATMISRLLREEIGPRPELRSRLVAAYTIGLPPGERPDPAVTPPCVSASDTGCFVAYSAFRSTSPPVDDSFFARSTEPGACANPASLGGGSAPVRSYFTAHSNQWLDPSRGSVTTPFVSVPGLLQATCARRDPFAWLEVTVDGDGAGGRATDISSSVLPPSWGLHYDEVQLALGDLVALASRQAGVPPAGDRMSR